MNLFQMGELNRAINKIVLNFNVFNSIKIKYLQAGLPINVTDDVICRFNKEKADALISHYLFNKRKGLRRLSFCSC